MTKTTVHSWVARDKERVDVGRLVSEHYATVYRFCARRLDPELAKDAAQETFISAQKNYRRFDGSSQVKTWLLGIANNHCRNLARKRKQDIQFDDVWAPPGSGEQGLIDAAVLREAIRKLSIEHREAVVMHEIEGLTYEEIATVLNIPAGTVKSRLYHAFLQLRKALAPATPVTQ